LVEILNDKICAFYYRFAPHETGKGGEAIDNGLDLAIRHAVTDCEYRTFEAHLTHGSAFAGLLRQKGLFVETGIVSLFIEENGNGVNSPFVDA
jgi:hypothetical protein